MKFKDIKRHLTISKDEINRYISHVMVARNAYAEEGKPIEDINELLLKLMKMKKRVHA